MFKWLFNLGREQEDTPEPEVLEEKVIDFSKFMDEELEYREIKYADAEEDLIGVNLARQQVVPSFSERYHNLLENAPDKDTRRAIYSINFVPLRCFAKEDCLESRRLGNEILRLYESLIEADPVYVCAFSTYMNEKSARLGLSGGIRQLYSWLVSQDLLSKGLTNIAGKIKEKPRDEKYIIMHEIFDAAISDVEDPREIRLPDVLNKYN
ncbi:MAG: hypothetical protein JW924_02800 [Fusobacteriaceae bacterium]|nr:hypothetical protein [Fusobacteriaceae bacterium]